MQVRKSIRAKFVCGVGINDADYNISRSLDGRIIWRCPFYVVWSSMLVRCYSEKEKLRLPTYKDCKVCDEWLIFSNFKAWMETQDWEGKDLDKDLLKEGNKVYSPEICIFVDHKINTFVLHHGNGSGQYMIGVHLHKKLNKFRARCCNPFNGKQESLGLFTTELEAHLAWKARKHQLACQLADSNYCNDGRLAEALRTRYL